MGAVIDLEELPVTNSVEFLREHMLRAPIPLALEPHPGAEVVVRSRVADLGRVHLLSSRAQGGDVIRTARLARDGTEPYLMVSVVDHGTAMVVRGESATTLRAGDIGLYMSDEPYRLRFSPGAVRHTYQVPLDTLGLDREVFMSQLDGPIHPHHAITAAVSAFLRTAARSAPFSTPDEQSLLQVPVLDLVRLLLTRPIADTQLGRQAAARSLATRIEEHVTARLGDPELSARSIAEAFSISERYVYSILARRGIDLGDLIREHRLERAVQLLEDPAHENTTIAAVAYQCGYPDHSHFTRTFRARYGITPSEWRLRHLAV